MNSCLKSMQGGKKYFSVLTENNTMLYATSAAFTDLNSMVVSMDDDDDTFYTVPASSVKKNDHKNMDIQEEKGCCGSVQDKSE